jgi:hypothetical protein
MFKLLGAMAAMITSAAGGASEAPASPIYLVAEAAEQGVRVTVVGASAADLDASFTLEVVGNGNRSRHSGSATLRRGERVTLSTVTLGNAQPGQWEARLSVHPQGGRPYEQVRTSL